MTLAITPRQCLLHEEMPMSTDPGAISLAPDGQERTRTDLITYATQFLSSSLTAGELLFKKLSIILVEKNSSLETIPKACESSKEQFLMSMTEMMKNLSHNPRLIGFSTEDAILHESLTIKLQRLNRESPQNEGEVESCIRELRRISEKISTSLSEPLIYSKKLKAQLIQTREEIISLSKVAARHFQESCESLLSNPLFQFLTFEERSSLLEVQKGAFQIEMNKERSRILLASKEWRRDVRTDFPYFIRDRLNEAGQGHFISSFQAAGPAYCSQLPRKRTPDRTTLINFFSLPLRIVKIRP
jgi:hypothetical protein